MVSFSLQAGTRHLRAHAPRLQTAPTAGCSLCGRRVWPGHIMMCGAGIGRLLLALALAGLALAAGLGGDGAEVSLALLPAPLPRMEPGPAAAVGSRALLQAGGSAGSALVGSLQDLVQAASNPNITTFVVTQSIVLNGTEVLISRPGKAVSIVSQNSGNCASGDVGCPLLDAGGRSRVFNIAAAQVLIRGLRLANGATASTGGCLMASTDGTAYIERSVVMNCTSGKVSQF